MDKEPMDKETEIVNDEFWLKYAKDSIENSINSRDEGAAKLEKMVLWFWGLYTASFTIGVSINLIKAPLWILILLALPIVLLILTYWFCVFAQLPVMGGFKSQQGYDPTIPFEIKEAYNAGLKVKNSRLKKALFLTLLSALILGFALFSLSFVKKKETPAISVNAVLNDKNDELIISGIFPKQVLVKTMVDSLDSSEKRITFYNNKFLIQENGILNLNIPIKTLSKSNELYITTTWIENKVEKGFIQIFKNISFLEAN